MSAADIVERGYFPWELPPCFHSVELANYLKSVGYSAVTTKHSARWTRAAKHNLARPAGMRRPLSIPNPLNFVRLAEAVDQAWLPTISPLLGTAQLSVRRPTPSHGPRAFAAFASYSDAEAKALARSGARVLLKADVQNFYPAIYTHSIPWALGTKSLAKTNINNPSFPGNAIDRAIREGQDGQTMGIPIGCDTSWVLAECILARVEEGLRARLGTVRGHRYNDDFQMSFRSASEAETGLGALHEALAEYELAVNPKKTTISELPDLIESSGVDALRRWEFRPGAQAQRTDIIGYFDTLSEHILRERGGQIASYAIARLRTQTFLPSSWPLLEGLLLQLLVAEPFSAKQVAMTLSMLCAAGHTVSPAQMSDAAERLIVYHAPLGHGSEVAWALWLSLAHKAPISQSAAGAAAKMGDCFVALLALHAQASGGIAGTLNTSLWEGLMTTEELTGSCWLLSYEARLKQWLPSKTGSNHVLADPFFADLFKSNVSFYDVGALSLSFQPPVFHVGGGAGGAGYANP